MKKTMINEQGYMLFDGAFATYYASLYEVHEACEMANINHPQRVLEIHQAYIAAGCDAIKTNTFGANIQTLECSIEQVKKVIQAGYRLAKQASEGTVCKVFADIGPFLEQKNVDIIDQMKETVDIFIQEGAKNFLFETYMNAQGLAQIAAYIKSQIKDAIIITGFAVTADGYTRQGILGSTLIQEMRACKDVDGYGYNCVCGPMHLHRLLQQLRKEPSDMIMIMPNAGYPTIVHDRTYFRDNSTYFANEMKGIIEDGAAIIGGCCGTTPVYIKEIRKALTIAQKQTWKQHIDMKPEAVVHETYNELYEKMEQGERIIAVEFDPPASCDIHKFMENAEFLREVGIDAITIADCPIARARVDSSILAVKLRRELGIQVIPHMTCRDRNINATKALLYGLEIEDVHNVLVVTGDPIPAADRNEVKAVFNFNSQILVGYIKNLNETLFPTPFLIFGALNVNAVNFNQELVKAKRKIAQGVKAFLTQPVLSKRALENLKLAHEELDVKILGGIIPIVSYRNAVYMNNEISGIDVEEAFIEAYKDKTREEASALAIAISCDIVDKMKDYVHGYYLITPFHRVEIIRRIVCHIQSMDKTKVDCYN